MHDHTSSGDPGAVVDVLIGRQGYLTALLDGPVQKRDLVERFDVSRSTVNRAVRDLEAAGLAERTPAGYRATVYGRLADAAFRTFSRQVNGIADASAALTDLSTETPLDPVLFEDADIVLPETHAPDKPLLRVLDLVRRADHIWGFSPTAFESYVNVFQQRIVSEGMSADLVFSRDVLEYLLTEYAERFREAFEKPALTVYRTEDRIPFGLLLSDTGDSEEVGVVVYGSDGITGFVCSEAEAATDWARRLFESVRDDATRIDP